MDKPISVGDLVQVVRWPHQHRGLALGRIYTVVGILSSATLRCEDCGQPYPGPVATLSRPGITGYAPLVWLKRIPPPSELGIVDEKEELHA